MEVSLADATASLPMAAIVLWPPGPRTLRSSSGRSCRGARARAPARDPRGWHDHGRRLKLDSVRSDGRDGAVELPDGLIDARREPRIRRIRRQCSDTPFHVTERIDDRIGEVASDPFSFSVGGQGRLFRAKLEQLDRARRLRGKRRYQLDVGRTEGQGAFRFCDDQDPSGRPDLGEGSSNERADLDREREIAIRCGHLACRPRDEVRAALQHELRERVGDRHLEADAHVSATGTVDGPEPHRAGGTRDGDHQAESGADQGSCLGGDLTQELFHVDPVEDGLGQGADGPEILIDASGGPPLVRRHDIALRREPMVGALCSRIAVRRPGDQR